MGEIVQPKENDDLNVKQKAFLSAFAECGSRARAATACGCHRNSHYQWLQDPEYRKAFAEAEMQACGNLEDEAYRRAHDGVRRVVLYQGVPVIIDGEPLYETDYSDTLLIFSLKGLMPSRYRDTLDQRHRFVDEQGKDRTLDIAAVAAYMAKSTDPEEQE